MTTTNQEHDMTQSLDLDEIILNSIRVKLTRKQFIQTLENHGAKFLDSLYHASFVKEISSLDLDSICNYAHSCKQKPFFIFFDGSRLFITQHDKKTGHILIHLP